mgnify:CR=1 FL=1
MSYERTRRAISCSCGCVCTGTRISMMSRKQCDRPTTVSEAQSTCHSPGTLSRSKNRNKRIFFFGVLLDDGAQKRRGIRSLHMKRTKPSCKPSLVIYIRLLRSRAAQPKQHHKPKLCNAKPVQCWGMVLQIGAGCQLY